MDETTTTHDPVGQQRSEVVTVTVKAPK